MRVHSASYTQCIHVSSRKLKLPKDTHTKRYKQLLSTHPFPKVKLYIAVKCKNIYRVTNNDNRRKKRKKKGMAWKLQWHNRKEVDLVDIMLSNVTTASTGARTKLTEERGSNQCVGLSPVSPYSITLHPQASFSITHFSSSPHPDSSVDTVDEEEADG